MANLHRFTVQEAVNTDTGGVWETGSSTTVAASAINEVHGTDAKDLSSFHTVGLTTNQPIYFRFTNTVTDACASGVDLQLEIGTHFLKIPQGLINDSATGIYLNMLRVSSSATVKIVLI